MAFNRLHVNDLATATLDDSDQVIIGENNTFKKTTVSALKNKILGSSPSYTTDTEPYLMRQTTNVGVVGKCALNRLVGGSLGWNQLIPTANRNYSNPVTDTRTAFLLYIRQPSSPYALLLSKSFSAAQSYQTIISATYSGATIFLHNGNTTNLTLANNINVTVGHKYAFAIKVKGADPTTVGGLITEDMQFIDLTQTFGSTIADYVYGLEQATTGAGVAWLSKYIDLGTYHAYDAGSIQSVQATAHVTTGFNQWDEVGEMGEIYANDGTEASSTTTWRTKNYIPVIGGTQYYLWSTGHSGSGSRPRFYDGAKNYIGYTPKTGDAKFGTIFTVPDNCAYMRFCPFISEIPLGSPVTLNISKTSGTPKNGDYVAYNGHTYPLGSDTLRGIPQLVSNKLSYDGDEKYPDGTIKRKYGYVDLGSLTWTLNTSYNAFVATLSDKGSNSICGRYARVNVWSDFLDTDKSYWSAGTTVYVKDSAYSTAAAFKTAMSGVYLVYELATPTTESGIAYQKIQTIDADGTESFTTSSPVPVGHETQTPDNILAALSWVGE